jgi:hypothetical protein
VFLFQKWHSCKPLVLCTLTTGRDASFVLDKQTHPSGRYIASFISAIVTGHRAHSIHFRPARSSPLRRCRRRRWNRRRSGLAHSSPPSPLHPYTAYHSPRAKLPQQTPPALTSPLFLLRFTLSFHHRPSSISPSLPEHTRATAASRVHTSVRE